MVDIPIEQAFYTNAGAGGYRFTAKSSGFAEEWLHEAERLCAGFGERPKDVACPGCVFAQPFGHEHVAVVQAADQGTDDAGRPGALGFRLLVIPRRAYRDFITDPFAVAERFPAPWQSEGELPALSWPAQQPPRRTVERVKHMLKNGNGPTLLGGVQALVDGGRLIFVRPAPAGDLLQSIWLLLPTSTRAELWPASFAFGNSLGFDVLVMSRNTEDARYLTEEQSADYPQGRYELNLQIAAEASDQRELDSLFARRNRSQTLRLALILAVTLAILAFVMRWLSHEPRQAPPTRPTASRTQPPLEADYPDMPGNVRVELAKALKGLAGELGMPPLTRPTVETLLKEIDQHLGTPDPERDFGPIDSLGPPERQLRALLWKHHVADFDNPRLNVSELVERLQKKVVAAKGKKQG